MTTVCVHQEDLRKRKEEEQRIAQENEFLRASLRGSKKLQALQESPLANETPSVPPSGIVNPNYVEEDDASSVGVSASKSSTLPLRERDSVEVQDVCKYRTVLLQIVKLCSQTCCFHVIVCFRFDQSKLCWFVNDFWKGYPFVNDKLRIPAKLLMQALNKKMYPKILMHLF